MKLKFVIVKFSIVFLLSLSACSKNADKTLYFIGDSIIARWDVARFFPSFAVSNKGISGEGISYVESLTHLFENQIVVVEIGTNNIKGITDVDAYSEKYVQAIRDLDAKTVYLFSILPRSYYSDKDDINERIELLNQKIKEKIINDNHIIYVDVYDKFYEQGMNPEYSYDGLHLNEHGYMILSEELKKMLL
ncbi:MAG: GDSL-type esterase/lipase family protein [Bacteroidales bacterium]|nr:GDSL-type esterase/lipase family protein [Bacteroidales bacterium]